MNTKDFKPEHWNDIKFLWNQFDPIGVLGPDSDCPDDEYDSYVIPTLQLLNEGADFKEMKDYVRYIVEDYIGLVGLSEPYIDGFVKKLLAWRDKGAL